MGQTKRAGLHHTVFLRLRPLAGPLFFSGGDDRVELAAAERAFPARVNRVRPVLEKH